MFGTSEFSCWTEAPTRKMGLGESRLPRVVLTVCLVGVVSLNMSLAQAETVYKYKEQGLTVYQDRAPDSQYEDGHSVLSTQGLVVRQVLSVEDSRKARQREHQKEVARVRDKALLATFTTEDDLVRTRDDRIGMIDGLISRLDDRIRILSERLAVVDKRIQMQEKSRSDGKARDSHYAEQLSIQRNIENAWSLIDSKAAERSEVAEKFSADLLRYRELKMARS